MGVVLNGTEIANDMYDSLQKRVDFLHRQEKKVSIKAVLVGNDPGSIAYLGIKERRCTVLGIDFSLSTYDQSVSQAELVAHLESWNVDKTITGVIIQLPLPDSMDRDLVLKTVIPAKDIDAFFYTLSENNDYLGVRPPAAAGMMALLDKTNLEVDNKRIVVVGYGLLVGMPLVKMMRVRGFDVDVVDSGTDGSEALIRSADVLMTGVGKPNVITPDMIKDGVVIIDAGYSKIGDKIVGDCDPACEDKASFFTRPVGGVGPLTVSFLLDNAVTLAEKQASDRR